MLRDRHDENTARLERAADACQYGIVFDDMFDHVESPHRVKRRFVGKIAGVGLDKLDRGKAAARMAQTGDMGSQAGQILAIFCRERLQHVARATSHFEHARSGWML
jgi:hypothetical protein